ncbi:MAG TPA: hypothetical protein VM221_08525 [Armatimonadota bacterium]|nr:hypothetical protein [Armatimonadota bacterium]
MSECEEIYVLAARTSLSPDPDATHYYGPPGLFPPRARRVFVSCTFTWDKPRAQWLAEQWRAALPEAEVLVGGPAYGDPGGEFVPGKFLREGCTITTRGCPGCASPCLVPKREGGFRCLTIKPGWIVQDNNLLAAPRAHVEAVLDMLDEQRKAATFSGGLEARRLLKMSWFVERLAQMRVYEAWLAYDSPPEREPALAAIALLRRIGLRQRQTRCYVLVGRDGDTVDEAERRVREVFDAGGLPFAMLWRDENAQMRHEPEWRALVRKWTRPAAMFASERTRA